MSTINFPDLEHVSREQLPELRGQAYEFAAKVEMKIAEGHRMHDDAADYPITPLEVAARLNHTRLWVYRHRRELGGKKFGGSLRFSEAGLQRYEKGSGK